jgi:hypothetical protein
MTCEHCGGLMVTSDKPSGFLRLYGAHCPVCWPEQRRKEDRKVLLICVPLFALSVSPLVLWLLCNWRNWRTW